MKINCLILFILCVSIFSCKEAPAPEKETQRWMDEMTATTVFEQQEGIVKEWTAKQKNEKEKLIQALIDAAESGSLKAYAVFQAKDSALSIDQVNKILHFTDTLMVEDVNHLGTFRPTAVNGEIHPADISQLIFDEKWLFDKRTLNFEKKVIGITLCTTSWDENGEVRGAKPLFYVKLNEKQ